MPTIDFSGMTSHQLVSFYNRYSATPVKHFINRQNAEERCAKIFELLVSRERTQKVMVKLIEARARPGMKETLKLDRTVLCLTTGEVWKNVYQLWRDRPEWLTSSQRNFLSQKIYSAAKDGIHAIVNMNGRDYVLATAPDKTTLKANMNTSVEELVPSDDEAEALVNNESDTPIHNREAANDNG